MQWCNWKVARETTSKWEEVAWSSWATKNRKCFIVEIAERILMIHAKIVWSVCSFCERYVDFVVRSDYWSYVHYHHSHFKNCQEWSPYKTSTIMQYWRKCILRVRKWHDHLRYDIEARRSVVRESFASTLMGRDTYKTGCRNSLWWRLSNDSDTCPDSEWEFFALILSCLDSLKTLP